MHVLIIEDDFLGALMLQQMLSGLGATSFDVAATEDAAVETARRRRPDLVTADIRLDAGNGVAAIDRIRAGQDVRVVFVTGSPESLADRPEAVLVVKPVAEEALRRAVEQVLADPPFLSTRSG